MKILFFIDSLCAGGKERRLTELIKGLRISGDFKIALVVMNNDIHYKEVLNLDIDIKFVLRKSKKDISIFKQFYSICKSFKPDIVHCWDGMTAVYSVPTCSLRKIILVNGMVVDTPVNRNLLNKTWRRAQFTFPFSSIIIGNSQAGLKAYRAPKKKSICIYNGMSLSRFKNLKDPECIKKELFKNEVSQDFIIGMVAAFEDRKDYKTVITAAIELLKKRDDLKFVLVGSGANFNEIKTAIPTLLNKKITLTGSRSDVESVVNIFDVGILLTNSKVHGEGISNSIIEYMALAKPVIATKGGGTNEVVFENQNGFLIESENKNQFIEKLEYLLNNPFAMKELGNRGAQMVAKKFDVNIMTENYKSVYQKLLKQKQN